jgi:anti-sigma regulatory factor (Ser/Thr protein kinase)
MHAGERRLPAEMSDSGQGFDPARVPMTCIEFVVEDGMGVFLMRALVDSVEFEFAAGTTVRLVKHPASVGPAE